ncbi:hypothetical protein [Nocardioides litoris]|uniref:hypothetical protein n=1 Tax=Nocardioides litoris TaxID=1926648 RepID=UPI0011203978|nr:hypothetical protein [Nocardioides litoris]
MTEAPASATPATEPEQRGTLDVRVKALEHAVQRIVLDVPGTVRHRSTLRRLAGGGTPQASTTLRGGSARLEVQVSCAWPCDVTRVVTEVRDRVLVEAARLTGIDITTVDVTVEAVTPDDLDTAPTRRVQ